MPSIPTTFLRLQAVRSKVGLSRSQIYKMISDGQFPAQIQLSARAVAWDEAQVTDWMQQRSTNDNARSKPPFV